MQDKKLSRVEEKTGGAVEIAAHMMVLGIDPTQFLTTDDEILRSTLAAVTGRAMEIRKLLDENLASMIINNLAKSIKTR